jgi:hypothetical protein
VNINERFNRLDEFIAEDRLVRKKWGDGQERACLLLALAPEVGAEGAVARCPAYLIPSWLAYLTPDLDDCGTEAAWPAMVRRYSVVVRRGATTLDDAGWRRVLARTMLAVLAEATPHDTSGSCARVAALWTRVLAGDEPRAEEWAVAAARAARAAEAAAAEAAWAAGGVAAAVAAAAGAGAAWARSAAAAAAEAAAAANLAAAWEVAWDRMTTAILDGIELECGEPRARREEDK